MFRRSDKGPDAGGATDTAQPAELDELDDLGAPPAWTFATATAWCRRHNWHLDGIENGNAIWDAGAAYTGRLYSAVTPDLSVRTPATFDRAAQTGQWTLHIFNLRNEQVYAVQAKAP